MTARNSSGRGPTAPRTPRANPAGPAPKKSSNKRIANNLVALSSVAILTVFGVGYARTQGVANAIASQEGQSSTLAAASAPTAVPTPTAGQVAQSQPTSAPATATADGQTDPFAAVGRTAPVVPTAAPSASGAPTAAPSVPTTAPSVPTATQPIPTAVPTATSAPAGRTLRDGSYVGSGFSRHGDIEATVVISGGRIVSANVSNCGTRYPCSKVNPLIREVVASQAAPVDLVSGATDSSNAYYDAVVKALSQAT